MIWLQFHPHARELCGLIPHFLDEDDPRPAIEQFDERYAHGGGWSPIDSGFRLENRGPAGGVALVYPGTPETEDEPAWPDEVYALVASTELHGQAVLIFEGAFVVVADPELGAWSVARMD